MHSRKAQRGSAPPKARGIKFGKQAKRSSLDRLQSRKFGGRAAIGLVTSFGFGAWGRMIADVVAIIGSIDIVLGDIDR